jgi:hypothetical protein
VDGSRTSDIVGIDELHPRPNDVLQIGVQPLKRLPDDLEASADLGEA